MKPIALIAIVMTLLAQTRPATAPVSIDLSTPIAAVRSMRAAVEREDPAALRSTLFAKDEIHARLNVAYASFVIAGKKFADATALKLGGANDPIAAGALSSHELTEFESAQPLIEGHQATLELPGRTKPLVLYRGDDRQWRIDLLGYTGASTTDLPAQVAMLEDLADSLTKLAADIHADRFATLIDVRAALQDRVHGAIAKSMRANLPTTSPASTQESN